MYTFNKDVNLSENDKKRVIDQIEIIDNCGIYFTIGEYRCNVNPATYFTFDKIHGESYVSVLKKYIKEMSKNCTAIEQVLLNIYSSMGYTSEEFYEDYESDNFTEHLSNMIGEVMLDYNNGTFNFMTVEERHLYNE